MTTAQVRILTNIRASFPSPGLCSLRLLFFFIAFCFPDLSHLFLSPGNNMMLFLSRV